MEYNSLANKKQQLDKHRPLPEALIRNLDEWFRIELTYSSNAIEGNTLTRRETALVVEKGLTVGGKTLTEHLEATNHANALDWIKEQITQPLTQFSEKDILYIHSIILKGIDDMNAGSYRNVPVRISGSTVILPNPRKVPQLMKEFVAWLNSKQKLHPVELAAQAHYQLVTIHPFIDGNGRTARLLMNLILLIHGYPPAIIRKRDRLAYITALENAQTGGSIEPYNKIISKAVDRSLEIYLKALEGSVIEDDEGPLLKVGQLASQVNEPVSTIRHWTKEGLIEVAVITDSNYQLYAPEIVDKCKKIQELKKQRYSLSEIKDIL